MSSPETLSGIDYQRLKGLIEELLQDNVSLDPSERAVKRLLWRDDMEDYTVHKFVLNTPADLVINYTNTAPSQGVFEGNYCLSFASPTNRYGEIAVVFGCLKAERIALELRWFRRQYTQRLAVGMGRYQTGSGQFGAIRWNSSVGGWEYRDSTGVYQTLTNGTEAIRSNVWNYLKITIDWTNLRYHRLKTNLLDLNLSSLNLSLQSLAGTAGQFQILIGHYCAAAATLPYYGYIDDCRLYLNEPTGGS